MEICKTGRRTVSVWLCTSKIEILNTHTHTHTHHEFLKVKYFSMEERVKEFSV
jgi:hypothetical protein